MVESITCPNCRSEIEISEALSGQLREELQKQFAAAQRKKDEEFARREEQLQAKEAAVLASRQALDDEIAKRIEAERGALAEEAKTKATEAVAIEVADLQGQLKETKDKLTQAQQAELEIRKAKREIEEQKQELELTVARKIDVEREKVRQAAKKEAEEEHTLKDAENNKLVSDLRQQIAELKRKSEEGSQQTQGEVLELILEDLLSRHFPFDEISPVPKGIQGGDLVQSVRDAGGSECGTILWESKRTKSWNNDWLPKLRDDQRSVKAQLAVLVSIELPKGLSTFNCIDGVWVTNRGCLLGLAAALRAGLIEVAAAKRAVEGRHDKMDHLYNYLSGSEFKHRVQGVVEAFATLKADLDAEKRAVQRIWAKREKELERATTSMVGLYGDLNGIIGSSLPSIKQMELQAITDVSLDGEPAQLPLAE